jgi:hypothetical protein
MFDELYRVTKFEHERSTNKEICIPYDTKSTAGHSAALDKLVDEYFIRCGLKDLLPQKYAKAALKAEAKRKRELRSLFWHFQQALLVNEDCYVRICLREFSYRKSATDNPHDIKREISKVIEALERHGFITRCNGFHARKSAGRPRTTRIRPCWSLMEDLRMLPTDLAEDTVEAPAVSIRKGIPQNLDHASAMHLAQMEKTVRDYNEFMRSHTVKMPHAANGALVFYDEDDRPHRVKTDRKTLTAIYHVLDPTKLTYGRIHGGAWQMIPAVFRRGILIDGQDTVELDYSAQVVHIIAGLEGIQLTGDPYEIDLPDFGRCAARTLIKSIILVIANASGEEKSAFKAIRSKVYDARKKKKIQLPDIRLTDAFLKTVLNQVFAKHPFLEKYAMKGIGKDIFMCDAEIARQIIQTFLDAGKVVLPIHDGFVVKRSDEDLLRETMGRVWFEMFGTTIPIKPAG